MVYFPSGRYISILSKYLSSLLTNLGRRLYSKNSSFLYTEMAPLLTANTSGLKASNLPVESSINLFIN